MIEELDVAELCRRLNAATDRLALLERLARAAVAAWGNRDARSPLRDIDGPMRALAAALGPTAGGEGA